MTYEGSGNKKEKEVDIESLRGSVREVLSYASLVLSRSALNPFVLTRMESEIGLSMEAIRSILLKIDDLMTIVSKEGFTFEKISMEDISSWLPILKRFQIVLENLPSALGPYGDFEIFNLSLRAKKNLSDVVGFLEDLLKRSRRIH
ncbi:MAG: hypothetical protein DRN90_04075 [Thermoproteota archaeon]|nr:MAG: hypothetical protein DRN90_04075 [Candidatus Korarchaeota archaeon]